VRRRAARGGPLEEVAQRNGPAAAADRGRLMIALYNPQSCIEGRRRLPLPLLALGSQLADDAYEIVDGNVLGAGAREEARALLARGPGRPVLAVTAMPGEQLRNAILDTRWLKERVPDAAV